ncbi:mercuric reductase [Pedobacter changchengzhani]|uniref:Mercuric reductase n=1 Tax=Pedobacter changchengzhani TaxID=2529274 RepID=A0A4R5MK35_9SPHI|nr:mercuric reductase [Pedobacter changchengzhani]TDG36000.1 mercuric reductase [Pedobacter changchengzhani]
MKHYDAIIIGAGQAGTPLAKKLAKAGKKTCLIEQRLIGGTCINDGCTPTKTLIASAKALHYYKIAKKLGVEILQPKVDFKTIMKRKDDLVDSFRASAQRGVEETKGLTLLFGEASFISKNEINVKLNDGAESKLTADWIFIDTGAKTVIPDIEGIREIDYLTSTSILELEEVPKHLVIIGGNYIGLEFGQMFSRFGSKVTILEKSNRIVHREDNDVSEALTEILEDEGLNIFTKTKIAKVSQNKKGVITIDVEVNGEMKKITCSHVLVAVGRKPNTDALNLINCGVKVDDKGTILVNKKLETNIKNIWALGDVKGGPAFTHIAYNDYTIVYRNLIEKANLTTDNRPVPYCVFTDPQLGRVGITEDEAKKQKLDYKVAVLPMYVVGRAVETGETLGFMKAVVDAKSKRILGVAILADQGGEIMSVLQMAMQGGITYEQIRYGVFAHPTYSEALNNLFMKLED